MSGAPQLAFEVLGAAHDPIAIQPTMRFELGVAEASAREIYAITLTAQIMVEPAKRSYDAEQRAELADLFGEPSRWPATTRPFLWAHAHTLLHSFSGATTFGLDLPCSADLAVPASRYADALADDEVPIALHFTGRVLYAGEGQRVQVAHIGWDTMASYRMPAATWQAMIAHHHGDTRFVRVHKDTLAALTQVRTTRGLHDYDAVIGELLEGVPGHVGE